jgi:hypothetical protein
MARESDSATCIIQEEALHFGARVRAVRVNTLPRAHACAATCTIHKSVGDLSATDRPAAFRIHYSLA